MEFSWGRCSMQSSYGEVVRVHANNYKYYKTRQQEQTKNWEKGHQEENYWEHANGWTEKTQ